MSVLFRRVLLVCATLFPMHTAMYASDEVPLWRFPEVGLDIGQRLPDFALPTLESRVPVSVYQLLGGKKSVVHIFASW